MQKSFGCKLRPWLIVFSLKTHTFIYNQKLEKYVFFKGPNACIFVEELTLSELLKDLQIHFEIPSSDQNLFGSLNLGAPIIQPPVSAPKIQKVYISALGEGPLITESL